MDDLSEKLDKLLSSPDSLKRIEEMMTAFGAGAPSAEPAAPPEAPPPPPDDAAGAGGMDMGMLLKLLPLFTQLQQEDHSADLLKALRPHLKTERRKRLDEATQMMKLMKFLPLLKDLSGKGDDHT